MHQLPVIRDAEYGDLEILVDTLSDSFASDPILNWVIPMATLYPVFFRLLTEEVYLPRGIVHMESDGRGAALWLPPGERLEVPPRPALFAMMTRLVLRKGPLPLWRIYQQGHLFSRQHPSEPHYYLQFIGCRERDQGQGIGSALLKRGTRICDEQGMPAYLESSNELNVPLYQRHGFDIVHEQTIPSNGPTAWFMWREPRQA
jgi:ribosomal protein S18 acetylase RimI-like enzyme